MRLYSTLHEQLTLCLLCLKYFNSKICICYLHIYNKKVYTPSSINRQHLSSVKCKDRTPVYLLHKPELKTEMSEDFIVAAAT